ncbi:MAG: HdeA/HdeB family chaperone [Cyanobacteria bacterium P01_A01_bin.83]
MKSQLVSLKVAIAVTTTVPFLHPTSVAASIRDKIKNMSQLTCAEFLDMGMMQKIMSVVWLSGWTSKEQERYMFAPDLQLLSNKEDLLAENSLSDKVFRN